MGASRFYGLLLALLFTAACAYMASAVLNALEPQAGNTVPALVQSEGGELRGIILRYEEKAPQSVTGSAGQRIPASDNIRETALFYPVSDGYEYLSPDDVSEFSADGLKELMASKPDKSSGAKLIYGFDCYYAAFYSGLDNIEPGPCRLRLEQDKESRRAQLVAVSRSDNGCALLFRLLYDNSLLKLRFCSAELLYQQK